MGLPQLPDPDTEVPTQSPSDTVSIKPTPTINTLTSTLPDSTNDLQYVEQINTKDSNGCYAAPESRNDFSTIGLIGIPIMMSIFRKAKRKNE